LIIYQQMATNLGEKVGNNFGCEICHYYTSRKDQYDRHINTLKHKNQQMATDLGEKVTHHICCNCNKKYKERTGLWKHKQKCFATHDKNIILELLQQNSSLQNQIIEMSKEKNAVSNYTNSHNNNSHNKTFNLNMFLNEYCKDAMNLNDFVDSLQFQLSDLEKVGELGYVGGLSNIIIRNLKALEVNKRPVHCSDTKRETIFIKQADKWEKENDNNEQLNKAIKTIANKNIRMIPKWREKYPECAHSHSSKSDLYNNIIIQSLDTNPQSNPKIISNIAKEVKIDK